jgi:hypothetical protein
MIKYLSALVGLLLLVALSAAPARAGIDVEFGASVRLNDDTDLYLAINSRYFGHDHAVVRSVAARYSNPDDLAVSLYIGKRSGRSADFIFSLRRQGLSWWDISVRLGLPANVWFVEVPRDPGPPYGKAYGHWKKHKRDRNAVIVLNDTDVRNLVAVRMIHEYYDVPVEIAMEWRSSGENLRTLMSSEYHKRHGKSGDKHKDKGHPGKGQGKGKK